MWITSSGVHIIIPHQSDALKNKERIDRRESFKNNVERRKQKDNDTKINKYIKYVKKIIFIILSSHLNQKLRICLNY